MRKIQHSLLVCLASLTVLALTLLPLSAARAADRLLIDSGHVDAFNVEAKDGALVLDLKEDVTGHQVHHAPEAVELHVKSAAKSTIPAGYPGEGEGYALPVTQDPNLLWPGWDTLGTQAPGVGPAIELHFINVSGPGTIHLFGSGNFGGPAPLLEGGATELTSGAVRNQSYPAHTHANWVFSAPGVYTIKVQATGTINGKKAESNEATYTFTVGDEFRGAASSKPEPDQKPTPAKTEKPATPSPAPSQPKDPEEPTPDPSSEAPQPDPSKKPAQPGEPTAEPAEPEQPTTSKKPTEPADPETTPAPKAPATPTTPVKPQPKDPGTTTTQMPSANKPTEKPVKTAPVCTAEQVVRPATAAEVKAATTTTTSTSTSQKVGGSYTVPANTHTHPNWVFSKPGNYDVTIRQSITTKDGKKQSANSTLHFQVGPNASGITDGHFDFGPRMVNGKLVPSIKDDRSSPAKWGAPGQFTFALRKAVKAPAGIEFVAPAGADVYMVPSSQVAGIPWLGANSMHESIVKNTTGEVTMTLVGVRGPGNLAVFTSGNFGQIVGQKWFSSNAGSTSTTSTDTSAIAKDRAHAKVGQVFKDGNSYKIVEIKGKNEQGEECQLTAEQIIAAGGSKEYADAVTGGGSGLLTANGVQGATGAATGELPKTGTEAGALAALALSLLGAGGVAVARVRRV